MRELDNWLTSYLTYTENSESPTSYHKWCGLACIAGALQRKVYLKWGIGQVIYPNMYVVLVGPSGRTRKGVAIGIAKDILKQISTVTITPESSSGRQAMIMAMKRALLNYDDPTDGRIKNHCSVTTFSEELSVFLGQGDIAYLSNLTDWYDSKDDWEYESIGRGKDSIQGVCLNLMGGTAPEWIQSMIPYEAIGGGFTSRVIFVVEHNKKKLVPEYFQTAAEEELGEILVRDLEKISKLAGGVKMNDLCRQHYVSWYVEQNKMADKGEYAIDDNRFAGYCERRATHIRKLMMLSSAARSDDLILDETDFFFAKKLLEEVERNMGQTFGGLGKGKNSDAIETVRNFIEKVGITTRKTVLTKFYRDVDSRTLSEIEETLRQMGMIKIKLLVKEQDKVYEWLGNI